MNTAINLFAGPGAGKSTMAAGLFYKMKSMDFNVELVTEYCKDLVYEGRTKTIKNQLYVLGKQYYRMEKLQNVVDYIITDSPLLLNAIYAKNYPASFIDLTIDFHNTFNNINFFIRRNGSFSDRGRIHSLEESMNIDEKIKELLDKNNVKYCEITADDRGLSYMLTKLCIQDHRSVISNQRSRI